MASQFTKLFEKLPEPEIKVQRTGYAYALTENTSSVTDILTRYGIAYRTFSSLQQGIQEYIFGVDDLIFTQMINEVNQLGTQIFLTRERLPITNQIIPYLYYLSNTVLYNGNDSQVNASGSTTPTKVKTILIQGMPKTPTILRIYFELTGGGGIYEGHAQIYKNGVAYGTLQDVNSGIFQTYSEDLSFENDDEIQLYIWNDSGGGVQTVARNFRILGEYISSGGTQFINQ